VRTRNVLLIGLAAALLLSFLAAPLGPVGSVVALAIWLAGLLFFPGGRSVPSPAPAHAGSFRVAVVAGAVVVAALGLRWPIAAHDVEHYIGPDEGEVVENVLEMIKTGDFNPRHPGYPGLHFYIQMIPARAHLAATGQSVAKLPRSDFYLLARRLTLVAGLLAAALVYGMGRVWLTSWAALLAASLVASSPLAFRESAVVNPDLVLMLFVAASLWLSLRLLEDRSLTAFVLAGASVGLASAIKYTGAFTLAPFLVAWVLGSEARRHVVKAAAGVAVSGLSFLVASPYTVLNLPAFVRGLTMHVDYYRAASMNAPLALSRQVATRGVGALGAATAFGATVRALVVADRRLLVVVAFPLSYLFVFSFFDRAFARHALALLPAVALLAADGVERVESRWRLLGLALGAGVLVAPLVGSIDLWSRAHRASPADEAAVWAESRFPPGSRVLEDQFTPRLDPDRFRVHRMRVEERIFVGNYDWVLRSGYPPGLRTRGLREVARFDNDDALGDRIVVYQVPERASLMPVSFGEDESQVWIRAGELPFFGEGWYPPRGGAFETHRLSKGVDSELFFVLREDVAAAGLDAELVLGAAIGDGPSLVTPALNGRALKPFACAGERRAYSVRLPREALRGGLNRLVLRYDHTRRLDRRHPDTAVRLYRVRLSRTIPED